MSSSPTGSDAAVRPGWVAPLAAALSEDRHLPDLDVLRPARGGRQSAVLALFGEGASGPEVLLVERAATLRSHPGQIAFPGGAVDPGDVDLVDTALREAYEECGVLRDGVEVLGMLPAAHVVVSGFDVTAVVAWWRTPQAVTPAQPDEVAAVLRVPVADLLDPANRATARHPSGFSGPAFTVADHLVWGLTAHLLAAVLDLAGWTTPWDVGREVGIPDRYLRDRSSNMSTPGKDLGGPDAH